MNAFAGQRVQVGWRRCGQRFTFTSTHFGDTAIVERRTYRNS